MLLTPWLLLAALLYVIYDWLHYNITRPNKGPWGLPLLYSLHSVIYHLSLRKAGLALVLRSMAMYGDGWQFRLPGMGTVVIATNPADVSHILSTNFDNYPKAPYIRPVLRELFGGGIFAVDGPEWTMQRKAASMSFRLVDIKRSMGVFSRVTDQVAAVLRAQRGAPIDMQTLMQNATLAAFSELSFGRPLATVDLNQSEFARHFGVLTGMVEHRITNPLWQLMPWLPSERAARESKRFIDELAHRVIAEARANEAELLARAASDERSENLLVPFLRLDVPNVDEFMRDVLVNFLVAGRDTTSAALTFFLYMMARNADAQRRVRDEIVQHYGAINSAPSASGVAVRDVPWAMVDGKLPFLTACIRETLRLYPPVPIDPKMTLRDDILPSGSFVAPKLRVKAGWIVEWQQFTMGRNPRLWPEPERFWPERWLPGGVGAAAGAGFPPAPAHNQPPWCPFQFGPRTCLGMRMAIVDMEVALIKLLSAMSFHPPVPAHEPHLYTSVTLLSLNGVPLVARELATQ